MTTCAAFANALPRRGNVAVAHLGGDVAGGRRPHQRRARCDRGAAASTTPAAARSARRWLPARRAPARASPRRPPRRLRRRSEPRRRRAHGAAAPPSARRPRAGSPRRREAASRRRATRSAPVTIATTPGIARRGRRVDARRMRACACGERRKQTCACSGGETSSAKRPAPVSRLRSSTRARTFRCRSVRESLNRTRRLLRFGPRASRTRRSRPVEATLRQAFVGDATRTIERTCTRRNFAANALRRKRDDKGSRLPRPAASRLVRSAARRNPGPHRPRLRRREMTGRKHPRQRCAK